MKWADYCIYEVKYNTAHTHIDSVNAFPDLGEELGPSVILKRKEVIEKIKKGVSFVTITKGNNSWQEGGLVEIIEVKKVEYIKTLPDNTTTDNLGELPEF